MLGGTLEPFEIAFMRNLRCAVGMTAEEGRPDDDAPTAYTSEGTRNVSCRVVQHHCAPLLIPPQSSSASGKWPNQREGAAWLVMGTKRTGIVCCSTIPEAVLVMTSIC